MNNNTNNNENIKFQQNNHLLIINDDKKENETIETDELKILDDFNEIEISSTSIGLCEIKFKQNNFDNFNDNKLNINNDNNKLKINNDNNKLKINNDNNKLNINNDNNINAKNISDNNNSDNNNFDNNKTGIPNINNSLTQNSTHISFNENNIYKSSSYENQYIKDHINNFKDFKDNKDIKDFKDDIKDFKDDIKEFFTDDFKTFNKTTSGSSRCPICMCEYTIDGTHRLVSLKCGHLFGHECIKSWFNKKKTALCPNCSVKNKLSDIRIIYATEVICENEKKYLDQLIKEKNKVNALKDEINILHSRLNHLLNTINTNVDLELDKLEKIQIYNKLSLCAFMGCYDKLNRVYAFLTDDGLVKYDENFEFIDILIPSMSYEIIDKNKNNDNYKIYKNDNYFNNNYDDENINKNENNDDETFNTDNLCNPFAVDFNAIEPQPKKKCIKSSNIKTKKICIKTAKPNTTMTNTVKRKNIIRDIKVSAYNDGLLLIALNNTVKLINIFNNNTISTHIFNNEITSICFDILNYHLFHAADEKGNLYFLKRNEDPKIFKVSESRIHSMHKVNKTIYCAALDGVYAIYYDDEYEIEIKRVGQKNNRSNEYIRDQNINENLIINQNIKENLNMNENLNINIRDNMNENLNMNERDNMNENLNINKRDNINERVYNKDAYNINNTNENNNNNKIFNKKINKICTHMYGDRDRLLFVERDNLYKIIHNIINNDVLIDNNCTDIISIDTGICEKNKKRDKIIGQFLVVMNLNKLIFFEFSGKLKRVLDFKEKVLDFFVVEKGLCVLGENNIFYVGENDNRF
ncbi:hypothetical protein DMUE_1001 [Dictyocoela muelleri]|nr:hypothetical protein DMUE_1001 [Dictyocoela muelleri]